MESQSKLYNRLGNVMLWYDKSGVKVIRKYERLRLKQEWEKEEKTAIKIK